MTSDLSHIKSALRAKARSKREHFVAAQMGQKWSPARAHFDDIFTTGATIASYRAVASEANPAAIDRAASAANMRISYPRIDGDGVMRFYGLGPGGAMDKGYYGIDVPDKNGWLACPSVVLIPLLAFDRRGTRLGQGGGYYDRALASLPNATRIGIAWSVQEMAELPIDPWDVPLHYIATEKEWIRV
ncbi:MAG: 5-formyltetrahydrofolate cyclo-ligase [Sphingopyxis sp.]